MPSLTFQKVRAEEDADDHAVKVTLFRGDGGRICGWYVGPLARARNGKLDMAFLPRSDQTMAALAILRALTVAKSLSTRLCVIDADDLWGTAWQG